MHEATVHVCLYVSACAYVSVCMYAHVYAHMLVYMVTCVNNNYVCGRFLAIMLVVIHIISHHWTTI